VSHNCWLLSRGGRILPGNVSSFDTQRDSINSRCGRRIHPRVKKIVGTRLAKAARALVYKDADEIWTGPVLDSCTLRGNTITLSFDQEKLKDDVIQVLADTVKGIDLTRGPSGQGSWTADQLMILQMMGSATPMEVQLNGRTSGEWLSRCGSRGGFLQLLAVCLHLPAASATYVSV
jgi:hypothetical protein